MTLVIGLLWGTAEGEAILVTSDSKVTTDVGVAYEMKKIYPVILNGGHVAVAGVAGNTSLAKQGFEIAEQILVRHAEEQYPIPYLKFKEAVREIEETLIRRLSHLRGHGIDPSFQMILGSLDLDGKASLYRFDSSGLSEAVHDNPGYAIIGSGIVTGGILLLRMIGYDQGLELGLMSAFMIDSVSEVDATVGPFIGESYFMRLQVEKGHKRIALGPLTDKAIVEYKAKIGTRRALIKRLWKLCDKRGEQEIEAALQELEAH